MIECLFLISQSLVLLISRHEGPFVTCLLSEKSKALQQNKSSKEEDQRREKKELQDCVALPRHCCVVAETVPNFPHL